KDRMSRTWTGAAGRSRPRIGAKGPGIALRIEEGDIAGPVVGLVRGVSDGRAGLDRALVHGVGVGGDDVDAGRAGCVLRAEAAEHHAAAFRPEEFGVCDASLVPVDRQGFGETQNFCQETQSCPCVLIAQARPHTGRRRIACFMFLAHVWESSRVWPRRIEEMGARGGSIPPECCLPTPATPGSDAAGRR